MTIHTVPRRTSPVDTDDPSSEKHLHDRGVATHSQTIGSCEKLGQLTSRQREVLDTIIAYRREFDAPPTYRDLSELLHIGSTNGINDHLKALAKKGYIEKRALRARGIRVLFDGDGRAIARPS